MFLIRNAEKNDSKTIFKFILKIAEYEKMQDEVINSIELVEKVIFDDNAAKVFIAEEDGNPVGFALFFETYSTFVGKKGIHLEDLYVDSEKRGQGYGKALFKAVAEYTQNGGYGRMEWVCLDWNKPSIDFYESMNAVYLDQWRIYRLSGKALEDVNMKRR